MTAMNLVVQEAAKAAFLLTDTASIRPETGQVICFEPKVTAVQIGDAAFAAVTSTGRMFARHLQPFLREIRASSLADFARAIPEAFRAAELLSIDEGGSGSMAAAIAAYDAKRGRAHGFVIGNDRTLFSTLYTPYRAVPATKHFTDFVPDYDQIADKVDFCDPLQWHPSEDGIALLEAQRADPFPFGYGVGGEAVLTRVSAEGISHKTLKAWPDRVGCKIDPAAAEWPPFTRYRAWRRQRLRPALRIAIAA